MPATKQSRCKIRDTKKKILVSGITNNVRNKNEISNKKKISWYPGSQTMLDRRYKNEDPGIWDQDARSGIQKNSFFYLVLRTIQTFLI